MSKQKQNDPPKLARRIFKWYCGNAHVEDLIGDMDEMFSVNLQKMSVRKARVKYWLQTFSFIFSYAIKSRKGKAALHPYSTTSVNLSMVRNYFTIAWRTMRKNKVYSVINVLGLALGISACLIVFLIVSHEFSFDKFHADRERIYRIHTTQTVEGRVWECICVAAPAYTTLRDEFAGAEAIAGYHHYSASVLINEKGEEKHFNRNSGNISITGSEYFSIFPYTWLAGNPNALSKPLEVVLTESKAQDYFGFISPAEMLGKTITYNDSLNVVVGGIVRDWEEKTDFRFTEFISFSTIEATFLRSEIRLDIWGRLQHSSVAFIKLKLGSDPDHIGKQLTSVIKKNSSEPVALRLQALSDIHFNNNDEGESTLLPTLYAISGLAIFILIIAAINFINLSTAQSIRRTREIGIRKALGSLKKQIVFQFLSETFVMAFIAVCLSMLLLKPLLSLFESFIPHGLGFDFLEPANWLFLMAIIIVVSLLAGTYPAMILSSHQPAISLSGKSGRKGRERWSFRKSLIVFQFSVSLFFIIATLVISSQLNFIQNADRGFNTQSVLTFRTNWDGKVSTVRALGERLRKVPGIDDVALQSFSPMGFAMMVNNVSYHGKKEKS